MDSFEQRVAMDGVLEGAERARMQRQPPWLLLLRLRFGLLGKYRMIWRVAAAKLRPQDANRYFLDYIEAAADFLDRYWCAEGLIRLNRLDRFGWKAGHLSSPWRYKDELAKVRAYLAREAAGVTPNEAPLPLPDGPRVAPVDTNAAAR